MFVSWSMSRHSERGSSAGPCASSAVVMLVKAGKRLSGRSRMQTERGRLACFSLCPDHTHTHTNRDYPPAYQQCMLRALADQTLSAYRNSPMRGFC